MSLIEQVLLTLPEHLSSPPGFSGVRVTWCLVLYVCFVDRCLSFCTFPFGHGVCFSPINGFWLPLWHLQTLLIVLMVLVMVFNATFNNISGISWQSVLLVEKTRIPGENHRPAASHWQTLSHNAVSSAPRLGRIRTHNVGGDKHWLHR